MRPFIASLLSLMIWPSCLFSADAAESVVVTGDCKRWHKVTLVCSGPETSETATPNPFVDYRLNAQFTHIDSGKEFTVPGYFAADGKAADSSAVSGHKWHIHFTPDELGEWQYHISFREGPFIAAAQSARLGKSGMFMDGATGSFVVEETEEQGRDFRAHGRLSYVGEHYLRFEGTDSYFLKCGADAPENLLAYADFDGNFKSDGHKDHLIKDWQPHIRDWRPGDPTWAGLKGKGLIGAINYLASKGMNSISFLTLNIAGDDQNVFPYTSYNERLRFDISKLAQWEVIFEHAQREGMFLHFKTQEHENQGLLDNGGLGLERKIYYRELIARFGHHLALNWNLGEESGEWGKQVTMGQGTINRRAMAEYFYNHDPYQHLVVIHNGWQFDDMLGNDSKLTGASVQTSQPDFSQVHAAILKWRSRSAKAGKRWVVACDEPGDAQHALLPDADNPNHDNARINGLWGTLMAGGAGIEWYFGYAHPHSDLTCQDWRSRDLMWDQCRFALEFFAGTTPGSVAAIPFQEMAPNDALVSNDNFCFARPGKIWLVLLKRGGQATLHVAQPKFPLEVQWFNPRNGVFLKRQTSTVSNADGEVTLLAPDNKDWLAVVRAREQKEVAP